MSLGYGMTITGGSLQSPGCKMVDNYIDMGLLGRINTPVLKCEIPNTNAVWGNNAVAGTLPFFGVDAVPVLEKCQPDEVDTGLTCNKDPVCTTEQDLNMPMRGLFGEFIGYFMKTTCTKPSIRPKKFM